MIKYFASRLFWLFVAASMLGMTIPAETQAASWYWGKHPAYERLVIAFDTQVKNFTLTRTGKNELTFVTPQKKQAVKSFKPVKNASRIGTARFLSSPRAYRNGIVIRTKLNGFTFKTSRAAGNKIAIDIYPDKKSTFTPVPPKTRAKKAAPQPVAKAPQKRPTVAKQPASAKRPVVKKQAPVIQPPAAAPANTTAHKVPKETAQQHNIPPATKAPKVTPASKTAPAKPSVTAGKQQTGKKRPFFAADNTFRSRINAGGPEEWVARPSTTMVSQTQPVLAKAAAEKAATAQADTKKNTTKASTEQRRAASVAPTDGKSAIKEPTTKVADVKVPEPTLEKVVSSEEETKVVWVDKDGNEVPPPPSPKSTLRLAKTSLNNGIYEDALKLYKELKALPTLTQEQRAEVLNGIADTVYAQGKDDLANHYERIVGTTTEAMNFDLKSPSVPSHLLRLGLTNLKIGNIREAGAYFNILRRNHPRSDLVPATYYYWGEHYFKEKDWQNAADNFQYIV
ncbi:MAG: hypothetical protein MI749_19525 [Desulfovibrionales bacterium]|nr:hypothetical protein [Desulfovibrionales bacterium]